MCYSNLGGGVKRGNCHCCLVTCVVHPYLLTEVRNEVMNQVLAWGLTVQQAKTDKSWYSNYSSATSVASMLPWYAHDRGQRRQPTCSKKLPRNLSFNISTKIMDSSKSASPNNISNCFKSVQLSIPRRRKLLEKQLYNQTCLVIMHIRYSIEL